MTGAADRMVEAARSAVGRETEYRLGGRRRLEKAHRPEDTEDDSDLSSDDYVHARPRRRIHGDIAPSSRTTTIDDRPRPLSPEDRRSSDRVGQEKEDEARMRRMNSQMYTMIKQGREALSRDMTYDDNLSDYESPSHLLVDDDEIFQEILYAFVYSKWLDWTSFLKCRNQRGRRRDVNHFLNELVSGFKAYSLKNLVVRICDSIKNNQNTLVSRICNQPSHDSPAPTSRWAGGVRRSLFHLLEMHMDESIPVHRSLLKELLHVLMCDIYSSNAEDVPFYVRKDVLGDLLGLLEVFLSDIQKSVNRRSYRQFADFQRVHNMAKALEASLKSFWDPRNPHSYHHDPLPLMGSHLMDNFLPSFGRRNSKWWKVQSFRQTIRDTEGFGKLKKALDKYGQIAAWQYHWRIFKSLITPSMPAPPYTTRILYTCVCMIIVSVS